MAEENALLNKKEKIDYEILGSLDFDELEEKLQAQLEDELTDLEFLEEEKDKIGNPDALGKAVMDEVWKQFSEQIGLDMTKETLIQKYDREHQGETYSEVGKKVLQDSKYKEAKKAMKEQQRSGNLKDEYTGRNIGKNENANPDHVVSRVDLYENLRRRQANLNTEELANKDENLKATNESLNKSKGRKSIPEYLKDREQREKKLREKNERENKKIDESNMSDVEKRKAKEKNNKRLQDILDADSELMKKVDKEARAAINKDIAKGVVKETAKKAGKDALKQMAVSALFSLMKDVINGLIRFLKNKAKSFNTFLEEMKKSIKVFLGKISSFLHTGVSSFTGTIISEIFAPITRLFKHLSSIIKQGVSSVIDAVKYLKDKKNKNKSFSVKVAEVGKIITAGFVVIGAISLGELFEKLLMTVPGMMTELPLIGTLANMTGMFLASLLSGIAGAIIINFIDKFIAKKQGQDITKRQINKKNEILNAQVKLALVNDAKLEKTKMNVGYTIKNRHQEAEKIIREATDDIDNIDKSISRREEDIFTIGEDICNRGEEISAIGEDVYNRGEEISAIVEDVYNRGENISAILEDIFSNENVYDTEANNINLTYK